MRWAVRAGLLAAVAVLGRGGGSALADEAVSARGVRLTLEAPEGCPTATAIAAKLDEALEADVVDSSVAVRIERASVGFELEMVIDERPERARQLRARRCQEAVDAAVLVLSLALLPEPTEPTPETDSAPTDRGLSGQIADSERPAVPPPPIEETKPPVAIDKPLAPAESPISLSLGAAAAVDGGTLPDLAGGVGIALDARRGDLTLGAAVTYFPTHRAVVDEMGAGAEINATAISARGCRLTGPLWLCLGGEVNLLGASGVGIENAETERFVLWGFTTAVRYRLQVADRLSLGTTAELVGHPARPSYFIENPRRLVHRPGWLSGRVWLIGEVVIY